jgi:aspartyl-tRNA synthetase
MIRTPIASLSARIGETVTIAGWVHTLRLQRAMQFVLIRDHTGVVQVTHRRDGSALETELGRLTVESAVRVTGLVTDNPVVSLDGLELIPESITVENLAATPLPVDDNTGPEGRLDWRFLDVRRHPAARLVFAVATTVERAMREFAYASGCTEMHTPKLMGTASESGAEVFELGYFGRSAYLAQSPQFYKQMAIADAGARPRRGRGRARRGDQEALRHRGDRSRRPVPEDHDGAGARDRRRTRPARQGRPGPGRGARRRRARHRAHGT